MTYGRSAILCILTLVSGGELVSQAFSFGDTLAGIQNIDAPVHRRDLLEQLSEHKTLQQYPDTLAFLFHLLAYAQEDLHLFDEACITNKRALNLRAQLMREDPGEKSRETYCRSAFNLARNFVFSHNRDSALYYYNVVITTSPVNRQKSKSAYDIGKIYLNEREFSLAHTYALTALNNAMADSLHFEIQNAFVLMLDIFNLMYHDSGALHATDSMLTYVGKADQYFHALGADTDLNTRINISKVSFFKSNAYKARGQFEEALKYLEEAHQEYNKAGGSVQNLDPVYESELYNSKGILLRWLRRFRQSEAALTFALHLRGEAGDPVHIAVTHNNLGDLFQDQGLHGKALVHYQASIQSLAGNIGFNPTGGVPSVSQIRQGALHGDLFKYISYEAQGWWEYYLDSKNPEHCREALNRYAFADSLVDVMRSQHILESSKLFWREDAKRMYAGAISVACALQDYRQALYFSDRSKAVLVLDAVREHLQRDRDAVHLYEKRDSLREIVIDREKTVSRNEEWLEATVALDQVQKQLGNTPSAFDQESTHFTSEKIHALQQQIGDDEAIIQYFDISYPNQHLRDTLYAFVISSEGIRMAGLQHGRVKRALSVYHAAIREFIEKGIAVENAGPTDSLYELLIRPLGSLPSRITIVPDGALAQVGFDGLRDAQGRFLIETKTIRYDLSLAMGSLMSKPDSVDRTFSVLAFAPMTKDVCDLRALPYTRDELKGIAGIVRSQSYFGSAASTDLLFQNPSSSILHLATHASANVADPGSSWIAFAGDTTGCDVLYVRDLYTRYLPSSMVVVSACEGAYGAYAAGEGAMSVARGFAYAGAESIVTSLWQVNDAATAEIMIAFYDYLNEGLTKSEALRQAKLDYIQDEQRKKMELHPAWWSAFIVIGNDSPLQLQPASRFPVNIVAFVLMGLIVILGVWWWKQKTSIPPLRSE